MDQLNGYAVIDLETTGFGKYDRIVEIGVVLLDPELNEEDRWRTLVQPMRDIPNSEIHGITATDLVDAPTFDRIAEEFRAVVGHRTPVAHNAPFEKRFLAAEFARANVPDTLPERWVDTMKLAREHMGVGKLSEACEVAGIRNEKAHSALGDAAATAELLRYFHREHGWGSRIGQLSGSLPASGARAEDAYRDTLASALRDKQITREEAHELEAAATGLAHEDIEAINEEFIRQLVVQAWADGVVTDAERTELLAIADALGVDQALVARLIRPLPTDVTLHPGDRVALTGTLAMPREEWTARATAAGLDVGGVTKKCAVLVAANPDTMSGKARKAREYGVPIVGESQFAHLIASMENPGPLTDAAATEPSPARTAAAWIAEHPDRPLHELAPQLRPGDAPEATGTGIDKYLDLWGEHFPQMLAASAADLRKLHGVGEKRQLKLVELVVELAADGIAAAPEAPEPAPQPVSPYAEPAPTTPKDTTDWAYPTPEELMQEANKPLTSPPMQYEDPFAVLAAEEPKKNRAAQVCKWSAITVVASFIFLMILVGALGAADDNPLAILTALVFLGAGVSTVVSGIVAIIVWFRRR